MSGQTRKLRAVDQSVSTARQDKSGFWEFIATADTCARMASRKRTLLKVIILGDSGCGAIVNLSEVVRCLPISISQHLCLLAVLGRPL